MYEFKTLLWHFVTRLGEAQILLPAMLAVSVWMWMRGSAPRLAAAWLGCTALAVALTTATKVAFIGWGLGSAELNFTGISGHAMFAAAVLPPLLRITEGTLPKRWHGWPLAAGYLLAAVVAVSRVRTGAHSWSEAILGFLLGALASAAALQLAHAPRLRVPLWVAPTLLVWALATMLLAPPSRTHDWVTALSVRLSGRHQPYTRWEMLREHRLERLRGSAAARGA